MAEGNFKVFAESVAELNVMSDPEYATDSQRIAGVVPGLASPKLHNKLYKQATIMSAAIAQVLVERGFNAMDNDYNGLVKAIRQAFAYSVNDKKPNSSGNIDYRLLSFDDVYPVGSIYMSVNNVNPATLFGGTWEQIVGGRCLIGANSNDALGTTGGEATHLLNANEIPSHNHSVSISNSGGHKHNRGTMEITGSLCQGNYENNFTSGAFYQDGSMGGPCAHKGDWRYLAKFQASRAWIGETNEAGSHSHSCSIGNTGGGQAHNNMQPYLVVNIWKRTA